MTNKKFVMAGLVALLIIGIVSVFAIGTEEKSWFSHKGWKSSENHMYKNFGDKSSWLEKLGLPSDATETQIQEVLKEQWEQRKAKHSQAVMEKLGLPEDATQEQVIEALKQKRETDKIARLERIKAKLGLSEDTSEQEIIKALQNWREENKDLLSSFDHRGYGFHKGLGCNKT